MTVHYPGIDISIYFRIAALITTYQLPGLSALKAMTTNPVAGNNTTSRRGGWCRFGLKLALLSGLPTSD